MPSSVIAHFSYSPLTSILEITFVSGKVYYYQHVPPEIYKKLKTADSKGRYFNEYIKDKYEFKK
ncbi:MAG TPA: KTSC domain-containing protein [Daejeonella sp.]|nr:KTSC domain-containing protein [Daejeonella sp.]